MKEYLDKNDKILKNGDIIDIHQTVNGCSKFVCYFDDQDPLDIRYHEEWCEDRKYEYDKFSLIEVDQCTGEPEFSIIGNVFEDRWNSICKIVNKLNKYMEDGYIVYGADGEVQKTFEFINNGTEIVHRYSDTCTGLVFENNPNMDHGLYTPIKETNKQFEGWTMVPPSNVIKVEL